MVMAPWDRILRRWMRPTTTRRCAAAGCGFIVILRSLRFRDGLGEFVAQAARSRRRPGSEPRCPPTASPRRLPASFARRTGSPTSAGRPRALGAMKIARGQPIDFPIRINGGEAQGGRRNDRRLRPSPQGGRSKSARPTCVPGPAAPARCASSGVQVVVDLLPSQADPAWPAASPPTRARPAREGRLRIGSKAIVAAAGSSMTWMSSMRRG